MLRNDAANVNPAKSLGLIEYYYPCNQLKFQVPAIFSPVETSMIRIHLLILLCWEMFPSTFSSLKNGLIFLRLSHKPHLPKNNKKEKEKNTAEMCKMWRQWVIMKLIL